MSMLVTHTWWTYDIHPDSYSQLYHWLNLIEGCVWLVFAALVFHRQSRRSHSRIEFVYGFAFFTFGLSDFREAYSLQSWLILFKGANLTALVWLGWEVLRRYYPESKTF